MSSTSEPGPLQLVVGDEEFLAERAVSDLVRRARQRDPETELRRFRTSEVAPGELAGHLSPSLFAEGRVIVLTHGQDANKDMTAAIADYVKDPADGIVLVVQHAGGAKGKAVLDLMRKAGAHTVTCNRITRADERSDFVRDEVRRHGGPWGWIAGRAVLDVLFGVLLLLWPASGILAMLWLVGAFALAAGVLLLVQAFGSRTHPALG